MDNDERIWRFRLDKFGSQTTSLPAKICMNGLCGASTTPQWKRGWPMKAGGFSTLCYSCGIAYDNVNYCERFHLNEPGWRECKMCDKPIHCGCVVSKYLYQCLDLGGISCMKCLRPSTTQPLKPIQSYTRIPNGFASFSGVGNWRPSIMDKQMNGALEKHQHSPLTSSIADQIKQDENRLSSSKDYGTISPNPSSLFATLDNNNNHNNNNNNHNNNNSGPKSTNEVSPQPSLGFSLGNSAANPALNGILEGGKQEKVPFFKQGEKSRLKISKPSKSGVSIRSQQNQAMILENRVARRPAEGRGGTQLLPRYWPKMTDQELQQISGDLNSNCTITPLFEKVLSASDAGRIGRLVLPKACAEAYFPPINQSDGLPIRIRDIKGKEWTFQFRFWPNNNSRMYVLEGVTPCIQSMQLQAGDTVIFSRLDPEDKLVIGCRKATVPADTKEAATSALFDGETSCGNENQPTHEGMANGGSLQRPDKKKARNVGSKSKRLLMDCEDAIELKVTWEEVQELLCPPSTSKPTVVTIDDCEIEEYDEPPVFSKNTLPTMNANRRSCSIPDEIHTMDLERIFRFGKESKKQRITEETQQQEEHESSGLDALATAAVLGEISPELGQCSVNPTTRHPRHRPGCTCIVCIQPPSGKGKHKPNCICNVCSTVKRRFKTLMLRRKKRLSEKEEAEMFPVKDESERQQLDLNCDPVKEEEWQNMLGGLVPCSISKGTSEPEQGHAMDQAVKPEMDNGVVQGR